MGRGRCASRQRRYCQVPSQTTATAVTPIAQGRRRAETWQPNDDIFLPVHASHGGADHVICPKRKPAVRPAKSSSALKGADLVFTEVSFEVPYAGPYAGFQVSHRIHGGSLEPFGRCCESVRWV